MIWGKIVEDEAGNMWSEYLWYRYLIRYCRCERRRTARNSFSLGLVLLLFPSNIGSRAACWSQYCVVLSVEMLQIREIFYPLPDKAETGRGSKLKTD